MAAFRCKNCGRLEDAEHAGECEIPHACRVCGAGVEFSRTGVKTFVRDNWEVLADASEERLAELGLASAERHVPTARDDRKEVEVSLAALDAHEADWAANSEKYIAEWQELAAERDKLAVQVEELQHGNDGGALAAAVNEKIRTEQAMYELECKEFHGRHHAHRAELQKGLQKRAARGPQQTFVRGADSTRTGDRA